MQDVVCMFAGRDRLQGWKEIAAYLERDERTVKRWEKQRGLPVRRIPGGQRANVYCLVEELETWLATGRGIQESLGEPSRAGESRLEDQPWQTAPAPPPAQIQEGKAPAGRDITPEEGGRAQVELRSQEEFAETVLRQERPHVGQAGLLLMASAAVLCLVVLGALLAYRWRVGETKAASRQQTPSSEDRLEAVAAREGYLEGVYFLEQRTPVSLERARRTFEQSIANDPQCAEAYAGLADTFLLLREYSTMDQDEAYVRAEAAAEQALMIDPKLADAHAAMGFVRFFHQFQAAAAEKEFQTALAMDPQSAHAHHWYGSMLMHEARFREALEQLNEAQRLEPASAAIRATKAYTLGLSGRRDDAMALLAMLDAGHEGTASVHFMSAQLSLVEPRHVDHYLDEMVQYASLRGDAAELSRMKAALVDYRRGGEREMWAGVLRREREGSGAEHRPTFREAELEAVLGDDDRAIHDLSVLAEQRSMPMIGVEVDPLFAGLRGKAEFREVRAHMGDVLTTEAAAQRTGSFPGMFQPTVAGRQRALP